MVIQGLFIYMITMIVLLTMGLLFTLRELRQIQRVLNIIAGNTKP